MGLSTCALAAAAQECTFAARAGFTVSRGATALWLKPPFCAMAVWESAMLCFLPRWFLVWS